MILIMHVFCNMNYDLFIDIWKELSLSMEMIMPLLILYKNRLYFTEKCPLMKHAQKEGDMIGSDTIIAYFVPVCNNRIWCPSRFRPVM